MLTGTPVWGRPLDNSLTVEVADVPIKRLPDRDLAALIARIIKPFKRFRRASAGGGANAASPLQEATGIPFSTRLMRRAFLDSAELWSRKVPAEALRMHRSVGFDAVLVSGPPHSALVAGMLASRLMDVPLVVDARDPWSGNPGYRWPRSRRMDGRSLRLHHEVMNAAALVVAVSDPITAESLKAGACRAITIPNGFDPTDLPQWNPQPGPLRIAFMGHFYGVTDPTPFFDGVALAVKRGGAAADLEIDLLGQVSTSVAQVLAVRGLDSHVVNHGFCPHAEAVKIVSRADAGLVVVADHPGAEAIYTGKLFEYLGMGLPILFVGPVNGVASALLAESRAGVVVAYDDPEGVARALDRLANEKKSGVQSMDVNEDVVARFDRRSQVAYLGRLLDEVVAR